MGAETSTNKYFLLIPKTIQTPNKILKLTLLILDFSNLFLEYSITFKLKIKNHPTKVR